MRDVPESWPVHKVEDIWRGDAPFAIRLDHISAPSHPDAEFGRVVVEHPGAAIVLAVDDDDRALVIQQYRHPVGIRFVELPAGLLDGPEEDPLAAAQRELLEETGYTASRWEQLVSTYPSPGILGERHHYFLARGLTHVPDRGGFELVHEEAEMTMSWAPVTELRDGVLAGQLTDGPLALAVLTYFATRA
jgi:ADP-ribose pyrophosphatase